MEKEFRNISKVGFMKHNGGLVFRKLSESEYEYKTTIQDFHIFLSKSFLSVRSGSGHFGHPK